ncbi:restriction system modified-DNA reader domain-containing protein [Actinoplanes subglobosus]|uniref:RAMA domain-containing protein n=1 Tax=Actinoplanes subglobosus TaxID=1547892 RepID=A0ABV8IW33_9ACTN
MRRIEVDDDVYAHLERHVRGFEQPNDVLRRLLFEQPQAPATSSSPGTTSTTVIRGKLKPLLEQGETLKAGDTLTHTQVRKGRTFTATVEPDGWIKTDKGRYREPSPALSELVGTAIDGWAYWIHETSGKSLRTLRSEIS